MLISFVLNGSPVEIDTMPHHRTVDLLRDYFQIKSIHHNCSDAHCGSCLIMLDDRPVLSCMLPAFELRSREVWTMEGISSQKDFTDIVEGFKSARMQLCSICAPSRALATEILLKKTLRPSAELARETAESVQCSCCSTRRVLDGILKSAKLREKRLNDK